MKSTKQYAPLLKSLKTLKESGHVDIEWLGTHFGTCEPHRNSEGGKEDVWFEERLCKIYLRIEPKDTIDILAEKVIRAEELMDELEWHLEHLKDSPKIYDFLYFNLEA